MKFHSPSFFIGVGTVFTAIALGFGSGFMLANPAQKAESNRVERVASNPASASPATAQVQAASKAEPASPVVPIEQPTMKQPEPEAIPVVAKDDTAAKDEVRDTERKRAADKRKADRRKWAERKRRQQELEAATQVRQTDRWDSRQVVVQREQPRFGFFGSD